MIPTLANLRIRAVEVLSRNWYLLRRVDFDYQRRDGEWQSLSREVYDRGNGATILLYNRARRTVILTRQFRMPILFNQHPTGMLLESPAGLLDADAPADCIKREVEEETGYRIAAVQPIFNAYMSPGSVTERLHFFVAEFDQAAKVSDGGGDASEGEDIDVLEVPFEQAMAMIASGEIADGKTILLLYHAALHKLLDAA
ncbi:NUDIX domain-containing protein [Lacibacterium aquatile]|uniref:GDP-mannose pyrophosphatase n=1 Tax=Lacibacterium aquatile TaxID=1168082 RepID=A0ABW5DXP0_9PROT